MNSANILLWKIMNSFEIPKRSNSEDQHFEMKKQLNSA